MRLIDADKLHDAILDTYGGSRFVYIDDVLEFVNDYDLIESEDFIKHGKWKLAEHEYEDCAKCSQCAVEFSITGEWSFEDYLYYMHFCPNCGAFMREDDNGKE